MIDSKILTLRAFAACGTVAATAELTGYSPSAVSAQLRELQRQLGVRLLVKEGRGVALTAAGRKLVAGSDGLLAAWEQLRAVTLSADDQVQGHFALGGFSSAAARLLAPLAANLKISRPLVEVHLIEASPTRCFEMLVAERIDMAVVVAMRVGQPAEDDTRFEQITLLEDPLDVVVPADHPLADRGKIHLEELATEKWITDTQGSAYRTLFSSAFSAVGLRPRVAHEAQEWETMIAFVGAGLGVGFLPRLATMAGAVNVKRLHLVGPSRPTRRIVAAVRRGSLGSPLVVESLEFLQGTAHRILEARQGEEA